MASSSSSSSHPTPASSSQSWIYDVFLSFRGEDTRKTFVDHLYSSLEQQGIYTYKDDETLPRGDLIGPGLFKAIRESRVAVIVFSENYADSSWCLDELAYIMECMGTRGQTVMPIFYDVDPSDVRKQKGKYGEAFKKHELENNYKVESWRKALATAGNLSGWVPKDFANGHEAKCIKDITGSISSMLSDLVSKVNNHLVGIETRLHDLESKLKIGSGGVLIVGIWGVGGGGKTTLAYSAYIEFSMFFEGHCFLENIRDETNKQGLKSLQEKILSRTTKTQVVIESDDDGRSMIKRRLCHKTVLVVLDDVNDLRQLESLAGSHDWFGDGSRILITTRDENLLTRKADVMYGVSLLSHDEGIKLFNRHAYREDKPVQDYETLSLNVVSYAGGLPLALKVLGSFLYDKNKDEWISVLAKLKDIPDLEVTKRLRISYDGLQPDQKELFLDIACFLRRWPINLAMMVLNACSFYPAIGVKVLVQSSLINISNGILDMHDLIEEMAHYIVREEHPNHPEKHSRVWHEKDFVDMCAMDTTKENDKTEVIVLPSFACHPRSSHLISNGNQRASALPSYVGHPRLPHVVANMKKLRWIIWEGYPESSLPTNFQPTKLGCLILREGGLKELWQGNKVYKFDFDVLVLEQHLPNLKILDLQESKNLKCTPDFNGLPCLERLNLKGCKKLKEIHTSIGYHERLVYVNMERCSKLKMFPPIIRMKKLETLILAFCGRLSKFPEFKINMDSLKELHLEKTAIESVPSSVGEYCNNLVSLDLRYCAKLKRIECNFRLLKNLKEFHLEGSGQLEKLADNFFDAECCLEVLSLSTKALPSLMNTIAIRSGLDFLYQGPVNINFPPFPRFLRKLHLRDCNLGDGGIPSDIGELSCLQVLDLSFNWFSRLPSNLTQFPCLKFLNVSCCFNLVELPNLPLSIAILNLNSCRSLESLGDLSNYKWLWKVSCLGLKREVGVERVLHSMLQRNAAENHFMSLDLGASSQMPHQPTFTLQLPQNWYSDFSGFLICTNGHMWDYMWKPCLIVIKQEETRLDVQPDHWQEFNKNPESGKYSMLGYVSFASLRHTSWWNSAYSKLSFEVAGINNLKVGLVPRKCNGDSNEGAKGAIDSSEFWDEEPTNENKSYKTFMIMHDSKSSIMIQWSHGSWQSQPSVTYAID